jgi:hypothetical protein
MLDVTAGDVRRDCCYIMQSVKTRRVNSDLEPWFTCVTRIKGIVKECCAVRP